MRDFRGLLKLAGLEKAADPPGKGIHAVADPPRQPYAVPPVPKALLDPSQQYGSRNNTVSVASANVPGAAHRQTAEESFQAWRRSPDGVLTHESLGLWADGSANPKLDALKGQIRRIQGEGTSTGLVSGRPFSNSAFYGRTGMPERMVLNIGGYGEGSGNPKLFGRSVSPNPVLDGSTIPAENVISFQHSQGRAAQEALDYLRAAGIDTSVIGHSYGGDTAAHMAVDPRNANTQFHLIDPVGRMNPVEPKDWTDNMHVYRPRKFNPLDMYDIVAKVGRQYDKADRTNYYNGGHIAGTYDLASRIYGAP